MQAEQQEPRISLITTVKNEADNIAELLDSMLAQSLSPDEIVINDNGSSDATADIIQQYIDRGIHPIRLVHGGHNIPSGRNNAIRHARGAIIASCDAGLTLPPDWLLSITAPLLGGEADIVGGFFTPDARSLWEVALGAANYPDAEEINPDTFLPAGQSIAFTRAAWEAVGGFPEWADTCEDLIFDIALRERGFRFAWAPTAAVRFRPRSTPRGYFWQYFSYARGDGVAGLFTLRHVIRYSSYALLLVLVSIAYRWRAAVLWLIVLGAAVHVRRSLRRAWKHSRALTRRQRYVVLALAPAIRLIGDVAKMLGYPVGLWRRCKMRDGPRHAKCRAK